MLTYVRFQLFVSLLSGIAFARSMVTLIDMFVPAVDLNVIFTTALPVPGTLLTTLLFSSVPLTMTLTFTFVAFGVEGLETFTRANVLLV